MKLKIYWTGEYDYEARTLYDLAAKSYDAGDSFGDLLEKVIEATPPHKYTSACEQDEVECIVSEVYYSLKD